MKHYIYLFAITILLFGCSSDDDSNNAPVEGTIAEIENWANPEIINTLKELGFIIHEGNNPPNIEGQFEIKDRVLELTNVTNDFEIGTEFFSIQMTFSNQENSSLTVNFNGQEFDFNGGSANTQIVNNYLENSYITGNGNSFTTFFKVDEDNNGIPAQLLYAFTGEITENGISNIKNALFMLDNFGNSEFYLDNNTGRVFGDSDNIADRIQE